MFKWLSKLALFVTFSGSVGEETYELANIVAGKNRGTILVDKDFHQFFKQNVNRKEGKISWRCSQYRSGCKSKIVTIDDYIVFRLAIHNHSA